MIFVCWGEDMSAEIDSRLISFEEAARLIGGEQGGLHPNSIRQRKAGTDMLTHVPGFGRRVFLIRSEVMELIEDRIKQAEANERKRRKGLRLVSGAV